MATQGFLESLLKYAITVKCGSRIISPIDVKKFSSQRYTLLLENADILKMQLFELTSNNEMNCIETIVTSTMERLKNTLSLAMHDLIEMQIYHIVAELVMNVNHIPKMKTKYLVYIYEKGQIMISRHIKRKKKTALH